MSSADGKPVSVPVVQAITALQQSMQRVRDLSDGDWAALRLAFHAVQTASSLARPPEHGRKKTLLSDVRPMPGPTEVRWPPRTLLPDYAMQALWAEILRGGSPDAPCSRTVQPLSRSLRHEP
jgi:hypothetical protein